MGTTIRKISDYSAMNLIWALLLFTLTPSEAVAQTESQTLAFTSESSVTVDGTSNRDDWTVTAREFEGWVTLQEAGSDGIPVIEEAQLTVKAGQMAGGRSTVMDRLMHNSLKAGAHPDIQFSLTEVTTEAAGDTPGRFQVTATGDLLLAGVTRAIEVTLNGERDETGAYRFEGSHALLMSDFEIQRPTALFGALVTGDEVVVHVTLLTEQP